MLKHHGLKDQYGIGAMCKITHQEEGRFGRLFRDLPAFYMNPCIIDELTKKGGVMDSLNKKIKVKIPAGFVILGQFIDHDITLDITSKLDRNNDSDATRNFRTPNLDLDCIYGNGPEASAYLYQKDGVRLHTGATSTAYTGYSSTTLKKSDLSRTATETAIIGDFRNDENRILSQLQLAFIKFHNCVADYMEDEKRAEHKKKGCKDEVEIDFEEVRQTVMWHYQWIVLNEFLPLFIGQELVDDILCRGRKFYKPCNRPFIPIEFSAAAYRFGHSMIPLMLRVQKRGASLPFFGNVLGMGFEALGSAKAIVDWDVLFGCNYRNYERADALDIKLATILLGLPFITEGNSNLANRNLLRGQSFLLPSGEAVAELMESCGIETKHKSVTAFTNKILEKLGHHGCTPLWFYILAEAQIIHKGEQLGPVGGRIIGETIIGLLELDSLSFLGANRQWKPTLPGEKECKFTICDLLQFCEKKDKKKP